MSCFVGSITTIKIDCGTCTVPLYAFRPYCRSNVVGVTCVLQNGQTDPITLLYCCADLFLEYCFCLYLGTQSLNGIIVKNSCSHFEDKRFAEGN